jgi:Transposase IS66 family/IS66 C-terminal element
VVARATRRVSKNSETGKAIDYSLKRWSALTRFLDDGRLCMSNNAAERELGAIPVGRRNWTFAGSDEGARRAAAIYTLIATAKLKDVDPHAWLADVLARASNRQLGRVRTTLWPSPDAYGHTGVSLAYQWNVGPNLNFGDRPGRYPCRRTLGQATPAPRPGSTSA